MNTVSLTGRTTKLPELRYTPNGRAVCQTNIAVNRTYKNRNGETETDFIQIVLWGKRAEIFCEYVGKGDQIGVTGSLRTRNYERDGQRHYVTEVLVDAFDFLESRASRANRANGGSTQPQPNFDTVGSQSFEINDDDLPF